MIAKKSITIDQLKDKINILYALAIEKAQSEAAKLLEKGEEIKVVLENDDFSDYIEITLSNWESIAIAQDRLGASLYIRGLTITYVMDREILQINSSRQAIDVLTFEDIEFKYTGTVAESKFIIPSTNFMIVSKQSTIVVLTRCTVSSGGALMLRYNVPVLSDIANQIRIKDCRFKNFSIMADSEKDINKSPEKIVEGEANFSGEINNIYVAIVLDKNTFLRFVIGLSKSTVSGYEYDYNARLINGNVMQQFIVENECPNISEWGTQERIGENIIKEYKLEIQNIGDKKNGEGFSFAHITRSIIETNKASFMKFKKLAADKGDRFQESTINYHIAKCDEQFMSLETDGRFFQDKIIMAFGRELSNHGTSWAMPLIWISIFNLAVGIIIFAILDSMPPLLIRDLDFWYIFRELHNPFSTPISIVQGINTKFNYDFLGRSYLWISLFALLSKGFYAMCIYEFIRAARRFTLK